MRISTCSIRSRVQSEAPRQGVKPPLRSCWTHFSSHPEPSLSSHYRNAFRVW
jgi:hypothetical protein